MSEKTKIQWTDHTFNPWIGCTKVSPGCLNCYADTMAKRGLPGFKGVKWGKGQPRQLTSVSNWKQPLKWNGLKQHCENCDSWHSVDLCGKCGNYTIAKRPKVFCASLADWLDDEVPIEWLAHLLKRIHDTPNLDWLLLTKRPENWYARIDEAHNWMRDQELGNSDLQFLKAENPKEYHKAIALDAAADWVESWLDCIDMPERGDWPQNVWIGTSVEDQKRADERIPHLLKIPAKIRFLSVEPMLEEIDFKLGQHNYAAMCEGPQNHPAIHWAIFGGESGRGARPCNIEWIRSGVQQCQAAGVKPFVKQLGSNIMGREMDRWVCRIKDPKGGDMSEWSEDLRIREFPQVGPVALRSASCPTTEH